MLETVDDRWADRLKHKAEVYALEAFDVPLALELVRSSRLPFYLVDRYRLWRGDVFGRSCVFMAPHPARVSEDWAELGRHREVIRAQLHPDLVVLLVDGLPVRRRKKLITDRISFMVPGAQLFVPEMLLELREGRHAKAPLLRAPETFSPTAQLVTIAALLRRMMESANATTLARRLGVAPMSMVRAFDELQAAGVADARRVGRERTLHFTVEGRDLWRQVERRLQSPVRKVRRGAIPYPDNFPGLVAGESALALYTSLARPRIQTLAVAAADWNRLFREFLSDVEPGNDHGDDLQTWTYDPRTLAEKRVVDRLSLYLSVRDHSDERITQAAEQLLEGMPW